MVTDLKPFSGIKTCMKSQERNDLLVSWFTLSIAFALVISDSFFNLLSLAEAVPIALIGVGTGFIFHEMAHRQVARHFGFHAEFRAWNNGLIMAVAFAIITLGRFTFAAPGATYIFANHISRKKNGIISIAGPVVNTILGFVLIFLAVIVSNGIASKILMHAGLINFWFAFFNLLPIGPLDGKKVMAWNIWAWAIVILISAVMIFFPEIVLSAFG